jgi:hypothetical protein
MIEDIKKIKADVLRFMEQEVGKYGNGRMDVKQVGELADVVKDLAEAEYYCTVADAMGNGSGSAGYSGSGMGYSGGTSYPGGNNGSMGYSGSGSMGHSDPMSALREMLATASPERRMQIRNELSGMMSM